MVSKFAWMNIAFYPACPIINNSLREIQWIINDENNLKPHQAKYMPK